MEKFIDNVQLAILKERNDEKNTEIISTQLEFMLIRNIEMSQHILDRDINNSLPPEFKRHLIDSIETYKKEILNIRNYCKSFQKIFSP